MTAIPSTFRAFVAETTGEGDPPPVTRGVRAFAAADLPAGRGRGSRRLVERQLQGRPGDDRRREGRPDQPDHPGDRPGRRGRRLDGSGVRGGRRDPRPRLRPRGRPTWRLRRVHASAGRLRRAAARRPRPRATRWPSGRPGSPRRCPSPRSSGTACEPGDGPVLVTGASGGVGSVAVAILAGARPRGLGGDGQGRRGGPAPRPGRRRVRASRRVHRGERPAARVRPLGRRRRHGRRGDAAVRPADAPAGRRGRVVRERRRRRPRTTVLPFILRGVSLLGMDSANMAIDERRALWARIATDLRPRASTTAPGSPRSTWTGSSRRWTRSSRARRAAAGWSAWADRRDRRDEAPRLGDRRHRRRSTPPWATLDGRPAPGRRASGLAAAAAGLDRLPAGDGRRVRDPGDGRRGEVGRRLCLAASRATTTGPGR